MNYSLLALLPLLFTFTASAHARALTCDFVDMRMNRILDQQSAELASGEISFLFGAHPITGKVVDKISSSGQREQRIELSYRTSGGQGSATSYKNYYPNTQNFRETLASATLPDPRWGHELKLFCYLTENIQTALPTPAAPTAPATIEPSSISYEYASASAWDYCSGSNAWYCFDHIKSRAKEDATRKATYQCQLRQGKADLYASCYENCSPFSLPPDAPMQYVSCTSNCNLRCETP
jgi:hypothetical protein